MTRKVMFTDRSNQFGSPQLFPAVVGALCDADEA
eukprot:CAMPEP_0119328034 /NCGR_PEP_ID=MMETSP1333-20130426/72282_1 /TAXON_ID=418940 /ORGANISM="Scyphosphaera apsteinii, Strain RCC1455" /LENGTH=33 /DNA_ID= /DNA_START= /DNA_END= /DNA_ORIENTATION=